MRNAVGRFKILDIKRIIKKQETLIAMACSYILTTYSPLGLFLVSVLFHIHLWIWKPMFLHNLAFSHYQGLFENRICFSRNME